MKELTIFSDFATYNKKEAGEWVSNCSQLAKEAFQNQSDEVRLLGNLLVLEQYFHTYEQGLEENGQKPAAIMYQAIQMLWDFLAGEVGVADFESFANHLYACVLEYMVGEQLTEEQGDFYQKHFPGDASSLCQWDILSWVSYLMLELAAIHGGRLDFDEFEACDAIDFVQIDEMLNFLNDACIDFAGIVCPSSRAADVMKALEDVCATPLFQSVVEKVQKGLQDALEAKPENYEALREQYQEYAILPQQFAADLLTF